MKKSIVIFTLSLLIPALAHAVCSPELVAKAEAHLADAIKREKAGTVSKIEIYKAEALVVEAHDCAGSISSQQYCSQKKALLDKAEAFRGDFITSEESFKLISLRIALGRRCD